MIRYSLNCVEGHRFDAWFRSSGDYDAQADHGMIECPSCGSHDIDKALMAPSVSIRDDTKPTEAVLLGDKEHKLRGLIKAVREEVTKNAENVGPRFAEVARQMHDGEVEKTSVYGVASADEVKSLAEDGIEFQPLPSVPDEGN